LLLFKLLICYASQTQRQRQRQRQRPALAVANGHRLPSFKFKTNISFFAFGASL
jgi:hypothetical protein